MQTEIQKQLKATGLTPEQLAFKRAFKEGTLMSDVQNDSDKKLYDMELESITYEIESEKEMHAQQERDARLFRDNVE